MGKFVDVTNVTEVLDGDWLTISPQPLPARFHSSTGADSQRESADYLSKDTAKKFDAERGQVC